MFCPKCRAEFLEGINECATCGVALVQSLPSDDDFASSEAMAAALAGKEIEAVLVGTQQVMIDAQKGLANLGVRSLIAGEAEEEIEPGRHPRFFLLVQPEDIDKVKDFIQAHALAGVQMEAFMVSKPVKDIPVSQCPACETKLPENTSTCPECGLFLGDPDTVQ